MFEQYQDPPPKEKPDEWFYPTIIFAALTIISLAFFALNYSDLIFVSSLFSRGRKIEGVVSVSAKEQGSVKLKSIKICAIREEKILDWVNSKNQEALVESKKAKTKLDYARYAKTWAERDYKAAAASKSDERARAEAVQADKTSKFVKAESDYRRWFSPAFYFSGLNECDSESVTDSAGRFSLTLKEGKYALAARAERESSASKEEYFWLIWITPEASAGRTAAVTLGNDNLMTANPPEKVIEIKNL